MTHLLLLTIYTLPVIVWLALLFTIFKVVWDYPTATFRKVAASAGGLALQFIGAALIVSIALWGLDRKLLWSWIEFSALLPLFPVLAPLILLQHDFIAMLVVVAALLSAATAALWAYAFKDGLRLLWPSALVFVFSALLVTVGTIQFHFDVRAAADRLSPDCVDIGSFRASLSKGANASRHVVHAIAYKGGDAYSWSFGKGDFVKVGRPPPRRWFRPTQYSWFQSNYPTCRDETGTGPAER